MDEETGKGLTRATWSMAAKLCDSCKSATATLYCRADSAFLCMSCDGKIHAANKLASRHPRVWMCEVCEQAPASVTCKADAAALCVTCDRDIHSANPLARRHDRLPVQPFFEPAAAVKSNSADLLSSGDDDRYFSELDGEAEEAEAASWLLLPNSNPKLVDSPDLKSTEYFFNDEMDPYIDLDYEPIDSKFQHGLNTDRMVPVRTKNLQEQSPFVNGFDKPFSYNFTATQSISHSVSSSSMDVGVVPDANAISELSHPYGKTMNFGSDSSNQAIQVTGIDREARVLRYREKRKNRKFQKTIRYASRKAYAETRPRIKGRFAKRSDIEAEVDRIFVPDTGYGVVPSF